MYTKLKNACGSLLSLLWGAVFEILKMISFGYFIGLGFWMSLMAVAMLWNFAHAAEVTIPRAAIQHRAELTRAARSVWGMDAPVAVFAAQIHTESRWDNSVVSHAGAEGLAQFMPSTAKWLPAVAPETGEPAPFNPGWALRACVTYDRYLWNRVSGNTELDRMGFTLSAYNGGLGWVQRDKKLAASSGLDPGCWFGHVAEVNAGRKASAIKENRAYVRLILKERQSVYEKAGWGRGLHE